MCPLTTRWTPILILFALCPPLGAQTAPSFTVEAPNVAVDIIVTDKRGHPILGLKKENFKITEDGVEQQIVSITTPDDLPAQQEQQIKQSASPSEKRREANRESAPPRPQNITLLIDLGGLQFDSLQKALRAASVYVRQTIARGNSVAIYWVDASLHLAVPFTQDKDRLLASLNKLSEHAPNGRLTARERVATQQRIDDLFAQIHPETLYGSEALPVAHGGGTGGQEIEMKILRSWLTMASTFQARAIFVALRALSVGYGDIPGRKSVVIFSEGFLHAPDASAEREAAIDAANRNGVAFYVIDTVDSGTMISAEVREPNIGGHRSDPNPNIDGLDATLGLNTFDWMATLSSDVHGDIGAIAQATGGFLINNTDELAAALDRIEQDGSQYYSIAYHPANRAYNGAFRKIQVTLISAGNYRLRYRRGYWAIPPGSEVLMTPAAAQLLYSLDSGSQKPSFVPELTAALIPGRNQNFAVPVTVFLPGDRVPFEKKKDQYSSGVTLLLVARTANRQQPVAVFERYGTLRFDKHDQEEFKRKIFNINGSMPLATLEPITVQALVQFSGGAFGASAPVPIKADTSGQGLWLSSLLLTNRIEPADCRQAESDALCLGNLRIYLPAHNKFTNTGQMILSFSALDLALDPQTHLPNLRTTFRIVHEGKLSGIDASRIQAIPTAKPGTLNVLAMFDLAKLTPGAYTLEVDAQDAMSHIQRSAQVLFELSPK